MTEQTPPNMTGRNELWLNAATMKEIVQFWLAHRWAGTTPNVTSIAHVAENGGTYVVTMGDPKSGESK